MVSTSFAIIFLLSVLLHYAHGVECVKAKFYEAEPNFYFFTRKLKTIPESVYFVFHGSFWLFILLAFFLLLGGRWIFIPLCLYGLLFLTEGHHFIKAAQRKKYYPGAITSVLFPILGVLYWFQLISMW